jgi:hypothetical protein
MKMNKLFKTIVFLLIANTVYAQLPGIPYQAVVLSNVGVQELPGVDNDYNNLLRNTTVSIKFTVFDEFEDTEYVEFHDSVFVDGYGMINLVVGDGIALIGQFNEIDWDLSEKWLDVDIDFEGGSSYEDLDYISLRIIPYDKDEQQLSMVDSVLFLENGSSVDLRPLLQFYETDDQNIRGSELNESILTIGIEDGIGEDVNLIGLATDPGFVTTLATDSVFSTTLATDSVFVNTLSTDSTFINNLQANEVDGDTTNELQTLSFSNDTLFLSDGGVVDLSSFVEDTTNELQTLSFSNDSLFLSEGGAVDLSSFVEDTTNELQTLSFSNDSLFLSEGGAVDLSSFVEDTTNELQTLSFSNDTLFLSDGGSVQLSSIVENTTNELQTLSLSNDTLFLSDGGAVALADLGSDDQMFSIDGDSLRVEDGGAVALADLGSDDQMFCIDGDSLRVEDGGAVALADLGSDDQMFSIDGDSLRVLRRILNKVSANREAFKGN